MGLLNIFRKEKEEVKENSTIVSMSEGEGKTKEIHIPITESILGKEPEKEAFDIIAPKNIGKLDMVIAFDTTASMDYYLEAVRGKVLDIIPQLFNDNKDLRLGIVAFGDYFDMPNPQTYGSSFQWLNLTDNITEIINFVQLSKNNGGGDDDEFYELVIKKIIEESSWREDSTKVILLIGDANPHPLGYSYKNFIDDNKIDWKKEAEKASLKKIKIDTIAIRDLSWFKEVSKITNGISLPYISYSQTPIILEAAVSVRGSIKARENFDKIFDECVDPGTKQVLHKFKRIRNDFDI